MPVGLGGGVSIFDDFGGVAVRTFDLVFPTKVSNHFIALGIVDQSVNVQSHRANAEAKLPKSPNHTNCTNDRKKNDNNTEQE